MLKAHLEDIPSRDTKKKGGVTWKRDLEHLLLHSWYARFPPEVSGSFKCVENGKVIAKLKEHPTINHDNLGSSEGSKTTG